MILPTTRGEALESTGSRNDPPPVTPIEAAAFYFQRNASRAHRCVNPDCDAPYYLASKKGQKYCDEECAKPAKREAKRRWWSQNRGKEAFNSSKLNNVESKSSRSESKRQKIKKRAAAVS